MTLTVDILTSCGPGDERRADTPLWAVFDPDWYRERYRSAVIDMAGHLPDDRGLYEFWLRDGARHAHSPNRYFDELWYRRAHFDVENGIRMGVFDSGFQHYCETGHRGRSCHWLFSESDYFSLNPDLTAAQLRGMGFANGYDHYLKAGQIERRGSCAFFSPDVLRAELMQRRLAFDLSAGEFTRLILSQDITDLRTSWYFDPVWYLKEYAEAAAQIAQGEYSAALHHYLSNDNPTAFRPHPYFDETYYLERYSDVADQVRGRVLRNGYEHFVRFGLFEGRSPAEGVELPSLCRAGEMADWKSINANPFIDYVRREGRDMAVGEVGVPSLRQLDYLQALRAETLMPLLARSPLDFRYVGRPALSVIVSAPDMFPDLLQTLVSIHEGSNGNIQVIVLNEREKDEACPIEHYSYGVEVVVQGDGSLQQGWLRAIAQSAAPHVLMIESGAILMLGALDEAVRQLAQPGIVAVAPQSLGFDLRVVEAGLMISRDGSCLSYGAGQVAFDERVDFARACDGVSGGAILCQLETLRQIPVPAHGLETLRSRRSVWAALSLSLRQLNKAARVLYAPAFVLRVSGREVVSDALTRQEMLVLRQNFTEILKGTLAKQPADADLLYRPVRWGRRILVLASQTHAAHSAQRDRLSALGQYFASQGLQSSFFMLSEAEAHEGRKSRDALRALLPETCEVRSGTTHELGALIEQRRRGFDLVWIMGGSTLNDVFALLNDKAAYLPEEGFILDLRRIEALEARQDRRQIGSFKASDEAETDEAALGAEIANAWFCQDIVVQSAVQAEILSEAGLSGLTVLGDALPPVEGDVFDQRCDLLFSAQPATTPGYALTFLKWFVREVMTRLNNRLPHRVRLILSCETTRSYELSMITHHQNVASLTEGQASLEQLAGQCRLLVTPDEAAGCASLDRLRAGASGLPAVMGGHSSPEGAQSAPLDPGQFAEAIISLYQDQETWQRLSDQAVQQARAMSQVYRDTLAALLGQSMVKEEMRD